jgi:NADH dehydrogenase/NADH:ubiquinone oxidoreductase subunit G
MEITSYLEKTLTSELSGNIIDLCPVGALTSKPYEFTARSWELEKTESIDVMDAVGSNIRVDSRGLEVMRILPKLNEDINEEWISDKTRYACDGLLKQRLDSSYIRENGRLKKSSWSQTLKLLISKLKSFNPNEVAGLVGDLADFASVISFKYFFEKLSTSHSILKFWSGSTDPFFDGRSLICP